MGSIAAWVRGLALSLGAPGLFLVACLDSSFLSLPEIADLLVVVMVTRNPAEFVVYVVAATLGSLTGCLVMYYIGRKGGEALIRKRFATAGAERTMAALRRHGVLAVLIPAILPPPAPFKIFVLLAGVAGIRPAQFSIAVAIGRGARYLVLGILALEYGDRASAYMRDHGVAVSLAFVGVLAAGLAAYALWPMLRRLSKARQAKDR